MRGAQVIKRRRVVVKALEGVGEVVVGHDEGGEAVVGRGGQRVAAGERGGELEGAGVIERGQVQSAGGEGGVALPCQPAPMREAFGALRRRMYRNGGVPAHARLLDSKGPFAYVCVIRQDDDRQVRRPASSRDGRASSGRCVPEACVQHAGCQAVTIFIRATLAMPATSQMATRFSTAPSMPALPSAVCMGRVPTTSTCIGSAITSRNANTQYIVSSPSFGQINGMATPANTPAMAAVMGVGVRGMWVCVVLWCCRSLAGVSGTWDRSRRAKGVDRRPGNRASGRDVSEIVRCGGPRLGSWIHPDYAALLIETI